MSDQEIWKKMVEEIELGYFLEAYKYVTGERLFVIENGERPDFICKRTNGLPVGVELTKVVRDPESAFWEWTFKRQQYMSVWEVIDGIYIAVDRKEGERIKGNWLEAKNTILVIQLIECPISEIEGFLTFDLQPDFASYGFIEIWAADYTEIDAYGDIELFGLKPLGWWGYHQRPNPYRKPYG